MAHNQYQFQIAISKQGIRLCSCGCGSSHFPVVEYTPGKSVRIYCKHCRKVVTLQRDVKAMTEDEFVKTAAINWNTGRWDK